MDKGLLPGLGQIGRGYNIFGFYANPDSVKKQKLFNFGNADEEVRYGDLTYQKYRSVDFHELRRAHIDIVHGKTIEEHSSSFISKTKLKGSYGFFSAQLEVDFAGALERHREYSFTTVNGYYRHWALALPEPSELIPMLTESARSDLNNMEPKDLFDRYGTHFVAEIVVGGRSKYSCATEKSKFESDFSIEVIAEASYRSAWKMSGKEDAKYQSDVSNFRENSRIVLDTVGGDPEYSQNIVEGSYDKWLESTKNDPVWVDFGTESPLHPLWELCSGDRQKALESAYRQYVIDHCPIITVPIFQLCYRENTDLFAWTNSEYDYFNSDDFKDFWSQGIVCKVLDRKLFDDAKPLLLLSPPSEYPNIYLLTTSKNYYRDVQKVGGWDGKGELGFVLPVDAKDRLKNLVPLYLLWKKEGEAQPAHSMLTTDENIYKERLGQGWSEVPLPTDGKPVWGLQGYVFQPQSFTLMMR